MPYSCTLACVSITFQSMICARTHVILNDDRERIGVDLCYDDPLRGRRPVVMVCHGFRVFKDWGPHTRMQWMRDGFLPLSADETSEELRVVVSFLDDPEHSGARLDILEATERLTIPLLIVHGAEDMAVTLDEAQQILAHSDQTKTRFVLVDHAGHVYGAGHPFSEPTPALIEVLSVTSSWIRGQTGFDS